MESPDLLYDAAFLGRERAFRQRAIESIKTVPRPGGRLVVLDAQPFQRWQWRSANPIIVLVAERATNWVPQVDLLAILRRKFEAVDVATFNAGSIFIACVQTKYT